MGHRQNGCVDFLSNKAVQRVAALKVMRIVVGVLAMHANRRAWYFTTFDLTILKALASAKASVATSPPTTTALLPWVMPTQILANLANCFSVGTWPGDTRATVIIWSIDSYIYAASSAQRRWIIAEAVLMRRCVDTPMPSMFCRRYRPL